MMFSKKQLLLIFSFMLSLSACWKPEGNKEKGDAAASFNITSFEGRDETPNDLKTKWRVPTYKIMNYTACIEDRSTTNKAKGQKFEIVDSSTDQVVASDLRTTNTGCMVWSENLPYNYFAKQAYFVEMKRVIRATGSHLGQREVVFYVNPWAADRGEKDTKTVLYRRDNKMDMTKVAPTGMTAKALAGETQEKPRLWLSHLNLKITKGRQFQKSSDQVSGAALTFDMSFQPKVELYKSNGEVYWKEISQG